MVLNAKNLFIVYKPLIKPLILSLPKPSSNAVNISLNLSIPPWVPCEDMLCWTHLLFLPQKNIIYT